MPCGAFVRMPWLTPEVLLTAPRKWSALLCTSKLLLKAGRTADLAWLMPYIYSVQLMILSCPDSYPALQFPRSPPGSIPPFPFAFVVLKEREHIYYWEVFTGVKLVHNALFPTDRCL